MVQKCIFHPCFSGSSERRSNDILLISNNLLVTITTSLILIIFNVLQIFEKIIFVLFIFPIGFHDIRCII